MRVYNDVCVFRCKGHILRLVRWTRTSDGRVFYRIKNGRVFSSPLVFSDYITAVANYCAMVNDLIVSVNERGEL